MLFHGKALEIYTAAYQNIQNIDENEDLEVRVIEICFSVYFLYKNSFHSWATHVLHRKMQQIFQVPRRNSCIPSFFFLHFFSKSMQVCNLREHREQLQWQSILSHKTQKRDSQNYLPLQAQLNIKQFLKNTSAVSLALKMHIEKVLYCCDKMT